MIINAMRTDAHSSRQTLTDREQYSESHDFHGDLPANPIACELLVELRSLSPDAAGIFYPRWTEIADKAGCDISDIEIASMYLTCGGWLEELRAGGGFKLMPPSCDD